MGDAAERAIAQHEVITTCIDVHNTLDGIEARAETAEWLARTYRSAANTHSARALQYRTCAHCDVTIKDGESYRCDREDCPWPEMDP